MFKKIFVLLLVFCLCFTVGCVGNGKNNGEDKNEQPKPVLYYNPLTNLSGISKDKSDDRPVAVMINNISIAQPKQTGINKADIVYETEVEGGITRLMAVFQDITAAEKVGTIRSARYPYVDLAMGHKAIFIHSGYDKVYCGPHLNDVEHIDVTENNFGVRDSNGLSWEHRLYAFSSKLVEGIAKRNLDITAGNGKKWANFANEKTNVNLTSKAISVTVPFSTSYKTKFQYDESTGRYTRYFRNEVRKDYYTGETVTVKNVFVLLTGIRKYSDNYHVQVDLKSGDGYYFVNGTYTKIKWSKGAANNGFTFTNEDGTELKVNAGNSWVCIANEDRSKPIIEEPAPEPAPETQSNKN